MIRCCKFILKGELMGFFNELNLEFEKERAVKEKFKVFGLSDLMDKEDIGRSRFGGILVVLFWICYFREVC